MTTVEQLQKDDPLSLERCDVCGRLVDRRWPLTVDIKGIVVDLKTIIVLTCLDCRPAFTSPADDDIVRLSVVHAIVLHLAEETEPEDCLEEVG